MVVLKQVANVKYGQFVEPGQTLTVGAQILHEGEAEVKLKARGSVDGRTTVSGRLVLAKYNLADTRPDYAAIDVAIKRELRKLFSLLREPQPAGCETSTA
jgi:3-hydroxyacyl-[acyl-carrier-protein] dehydratase